MRTLFKRWWFWVATVLIMAGIAATALLIYPSQSKITRANFDRIQTGMTSEEVEQILGEPTQAAWDTPENSASLWQCDVTEILICFDADHKVWGKDFTSGTVWEHLRCVLSKWLPSR